MTFMDVSTGPRARARALAPWLAATLIAGMFVGTTLVTPLYDLYRRDFGFGEVTLTLIYAVYVVGNVLALAFFGRLSDQIGRRRTALPAIGIGMLSTLVFLFARDTAWLFAARVISGFAIGIASGTGTAWVAELVGGRDKSRASLMASLANMIGLSVGAVLAGFLAQYAPWPLRLAFVVYLAMLVVLMIGVSFIEETVSRPRVLKEISLRPRIGVPRSIALKFIAPAATGFGTFALLGFYAALSPSILEHDLHQSNRAVGGGVVFELCIVAALTIIATRRLGSRVSMITGLMLLIPSLVLLVMAQAFASMPLLLAGTAFGGVAAAFGYRGSLQVVNEIAPAQQRAEVTSSYLLCCYVGNAIPVVGVGVISQVATPVIASTAFAATIAAFAIAALLTGSRYSRPA
jgi:MFS family permease